MPHGSRKEQSVFEKQWTQKNCAEGTEELSSVECK